MRSFIQCHQDKIKGVLSGLDRIRFRGTLRAIAHAWGLKHFLQATGVLLKQFKDYALDCTRRLHRATEQQAQDLEDFKLEAQLNRAARRRTCSDSYAVSPTTTTRAPAGTFAD